MSSNTANITVTPITDPADFQAAFAVCANAFGHQIHDAIFGAFHPHWDTPAGLAAGAAQFTERHAATTHDKHGRPNTVFLKATTATDEGSGSQLAGFAIWTQLSMVPGCGDVPSTDFCGGDDALLTARYGEGEDNQRTRRLACQAYASLVSRRVQAVRDKAAADAALLLPATFVLDLCAVDPAFQRRGVASLLVQWGLEEAKRRGGLESTVEASVMGRRVYEKLGFKPVAEIEYEVDAELLEDGQSLPSNLFMRTGP